MWSVGNGKGKDFGEGEEGVWGEGYKEEENPLNDSSTQIYAASLWPA